MTFIAIDDQIELSKLDSRPEYLATIKDIDEKLSPPSGELFFEYILVDPLVCVNLLIAAGSREEYGLAHSLDDIGTDIFMLFSLGIKVAD